ncbi:DNA polymerase III, gamma subunit /DNA polymerase III, tau subunit [Franzmannia pantelleriensis]|uniref:DNA polymerase III subunit gamma/tau n=1 Tax=Franzmannia pantelleriensis TaxID=48727 RepID=A0A1G9K2J7_9GAMM|nr:DNA polymerase III subunit gamma/tau [Halomonas pantelleriensis]SDL43959.1 DNA polymerase III, gamma subunit /DNA polymerase III, tau subunit [Halomonas pantelleriensis]
MSYQVLARKWRPRTFHELVGQDHVRRALVNALDQGRLHHAYLFTGTRGVGKTTLARILAKCLNCTAGGYDDTAVTSTPCGQCDSCRAIDEGRFVDLIEVDAASRTKVEDTRELLDNVQYAPTQGRFKVYLIDEVHMLSTHSFNALLKTLEEPPPHVKFLLATTDPQKLPVTVLSRCLQFTLKNMPPERIVEHLGKVLGAEGVEFDESALWLLGRAADGSMRDAMSLTDQAIAFGQGVVRQVDVAAMLGTLDHGHLLALVEALAEVDAARVLSEVAALAEQGPDFAGVLDDLMGTLHRLAVAQMVPDALDNGHGDRETLLALATRFTPEDIQLYYQIGLQGRGDMDHAPDTRTALEMTLLRMLAFRPQGVPKPATTPLPISNTASTQGQPGAPAATAEVPESGSAPGGAERAAEPPPADPMPPTSESPPADPVPPTSESPPVDPAPPTSESPPVDPAPPTSEPPPWEAPAAEPAGQAPSVAAPEPVSAAPAEQVAVPDEPVADEVAAEPVTETHPSPPVSEESATPAGDSPTAAEPQGTVDHATWLARFDDLGLGGLTRNLAAHCLVEHDDGQRLQLRLDPSQAAMNAEVHVERVEKALLALGVTRRVNIEPGELPPGIETPRAMADRLNAERHAAAVQSLEADPHVQELREAFGARLLEASVSPQQRSGEAAR